jgi:hypothetical protein
MGFLDKMKDAATKATEQAKLATAAGKEKFDEVRAQKKISDLCQDIGMIVVAQRRGEAASDADAQINAKIAEIAELEKQLDDKAGDSEGANAAADAAAPEPTPAPEPAPTPAATSDSGD